MIVSDKLKHKNINHVFFSRNGGVSVGVYESLNCSAYVGDDIENVKANLDIVKNKVCANSILTLHQVHSNECIVVDEKNMCEFCADAMVTCVPKIAIGVLTADCAPILLSDSENNIIGAAHAGWKGAFGGVIQNTVEKMLKIGASLQNIRVAIGPCISKQSYEVQNDFESQFVGYDECFSTIDNKRFFDLKYFCYKKLIKSGVIDNNIDILDQDTYAQEKNYFSFRRASKKTQGICGRQISAICLK